MTVLRLLAPSVLVLALAACSEAPDAESDAPLAEGAVSEGAAASVAQPEAGAEEALDPLEVAASEVCAAGDDGFAALLPEGTGFASRGADARVHAAWNLEGEAREVIIYTPDLGMEDRLAFDGAVADFLRHNLVAGFDRTGLTGAFRFRDGRFCVVQTEAEVIGALRDAVETAQAQIQASE